MSRYRLGAFDGLLEIEGVESGPFPVRAHGFLQFSPKDYPNGELVLEVKGQEIWLWVAERKGCENGEVDDRKA